ncbi:MAG: DUF5985 family protein [Myxococcota bacterium]|nr:DUF5985 family protein [Myxococcota bacterium]
MTAVQLTPFLYGALTLGCFVIGLKFLKFWTLSGDRFFIWFAAAFFVFMLGWGLRLLVPTFGEHKHLVYLPRLVGFLMIVFAIVDKNRRSE